MFILCLGAGLCIFALKKISPEPPPGYVINPIWAVVIIVIVYTLLTVTGILHMDPQIPRLR